jgi:hypothetical protein
LSHSTGAFFFGFFEVGSHFIPRSSWIVILPFECPCVARMAGKYCCTQILVEIGSCNFCPRLTCRHNPLDFCLLSSYDCRLLIFHFYISLFSNAIVKVMIV